LTGQSDPSMVRKSRGLRVSIRLAANVKGYMLVTCKICSLQGIIDSYQSSHYCRGPHDGDYGPAQSIRNSNSDQFDTTRLLIPAQLLHGNYATEILSAEMGLSVSAISMLALFRTSEYPYPSVGRGQSQSSRFGPSSHRRRHAFRSAYCQYQFPPATDRRVTNDREQPSQHQRGTPRYHYKCISV
jgi:hypothetical protein